MPLQFEAEELDTQTVDYLRRARELEGEGMPGVYLTAGEAGTSGAWTIGCGVAAGIFILICVLIMVAVSSKPPTALALLLTAGLMEGGWCLLLGVRALLAKQRKDYLGYFKYVDPLYVYECTGRSVQVTPLEGLRGARVEHNYSNEGAYNGSTVLIKLGDETERLNVKSMARAEQVFAFLEAQCEMRDLAPVDRGYRARAITDLDEDDMLDAVEAMSRGEDPPARVREYRKEDREVDELPEPHQGRTPFRWWRYPAIVATGVILFFGCRACVTVTRDDSLWSESRNQRPPLLRGYLRDKYNKRHREEAQRELNSFHEKAAANIRSARGGNEELKNGLADIVDALKKTHDHPFILIGFQGKVKTLPGHHPNIFAQDRMGTQQKDVATRIGTHIDTTVLGTNYRDVAEAAYAPNQTATHILFTYDIQPAADGSRAYEVRWTALLRPDPSQNKGRTVVFAPQTYNDDALNVIQRMHEYLRIQVISGLPRP
jgi:hypothetical protein